MKVLLIGVLVSLLLVGLVASVALAQPPNDLPTNQGTEKAGQVSPAIDDGEVMPPSGITPTEPPFPPESELTKVVFIRYVPGHPSVCPGGACNNDGTCDADEYPSCADCKKGKGGEEPTGTTCYGFLSGAKPKWESAEPYVATNDLKKESAWATDVWEAPVADDIFGSGSVLSEPWGVYDGYNSVSIGDYPELGVLGVTALWYKGKTMYEYDIMLDSDYFPNGPFDLETVLLHEFGHAAGLDDLYDSACQDQVMYGWLDEGEQKLTLQNGDLAGITTLYGIK